MRAQFIRGQDPISSLNIGLKSKRDFKSDEEIAQWLYNFPEICTEDAIKKWERVNSSKRSPNSPPLYILTPMDLRLSVIKWVKRNLTTDGYDIGLKEAKDIGDRLAEIIHEKAA